MELKLRNSSGEFIELSSDVLEETVFSKDEALGLIYNLTDIINDLARFIKEK